MSKFYGFDKFEEGSQVKIVSREVLEAFRRDWHWHHPLQENQIEHADETAKVLQSLMYRGGSILYVLEGVPGIWHQSCLVPASEAYTASSFGIIPAYSTRQTICVTRGLVPRVHGLPGQARQ